MFSLVSTPELSEYVIQQDEEGEALVSTICNLKQQLAVAKEEMAKMENERTTLKISNGPTSVVTSPGSIEENGKMVGTIQRSQE